MPNKNERISIERYDEFVTKLCQTKTNIIIGTDQNFDFMKVHTNLVSEVLDVFFTAGVLPTVRRPTSVTHMSATVIDNIYIYMKWAGYDNIDSTILMTDISDHYPIIACMGVTKGKKNQTTIGV